MYGGRDPESIFVASACEYGVAVQGDGYGFRVTGTVLGWVLKIDLFCLTI